MIGMSKKKWWIVVSVAVALCLAAVAALYIVLFVIPKLSEDHSLPTYTTEQIASTHPGYRHTTLVFGNSVYVNDYEEYPLRLINPEPTQVIGLYGIGGKVCAIPGQNPAEYLAVDCGSEMPAYEVFRNKQVRPFDWRTAPFQKMQFTWPGGSGVNLFMTNQALITDVVRTLRDDAPATLSSPVSTNASNFATINLFSDQLPGMIYCPVVYLDPTGPVYLAESVPIVASGSNSQSPTRWISASRQLADWVHSH
jgi:hypothetical protein